MYYILKFSDSLDREDFNRIDVIEEIKMTNLTLWQDYFQRSKVRRQILTVLMSHKAYADVVRESQELVELLLKGLLRRVGVDPPKWHDVGKIIEQHQQKLPPEISAQLPRIMALSSKLRKEREMSFYGEEDFIPTEQYKIADAQWCVDEVDWLLQVVSCFSTEG